MGLLEEAHRHLDAAEGVARRVTDDWFGWCFGVDLVRQRRFGSAARYGEIASAGGYLADVAGRPAGNPVHHAHLLIDIAFLQVRCGDSTKAARSLMRAEQVAPEVAYANATAHELLERLAAGAYSAAQRERLTGVWRRFVQRRGGYAD